MTLLVMLLTTATAWAEDNVPYFDPTAPVGQQSKTHNGVTVLTGSEITSEESSLQEGWYIVKGNVNYNNILHFKGDTHLILADEAHLTISSDGSGIAVNESGIESNLTIYAQSTGNKKGKVTIEAGTGIWVWNGSLTINGGDIIANGYASGIDITYGGIIINGGTINVSGTVGYGISTTTYDETPCDIIINGGEVNATTDDEDGETGIYTKGNISINGGSVIANGSTNGIESGKDITITGGNITATTEYGKGIYSCGDIIINSGNIIANGKSYGIATSSQDIYINGGNVTATAIQTGDDYGSIYSQNGNIIITDGIINANGGDSGIYALSGSVTISGGEVEVAGEYYGIYTYNYDDTDNSGNITISGGTINATGGNYGIDVHSDKSIITINGGDITATGDSYGGIKAKSITLSGGIVNATATSGNHYGIGDESSTITLSGGTVTASSYNGTVKVADGFIYSDGTNNNITGTVVTSSYDINTVLTIKGLTGNQPTGADYAGTYWTTFYCGGTGFAIDTNENACAYTATVSGETITLHTLGKVIPAGTAVIIVGADNCICMTQSTATAENTVNNDLHGVDVATSLESLKTTYNAKALLMLSNKNNHFGFHEVALTNVPARKAFLPINSTGARSLNIVFEDGNTTGIKALNRDERIENSEDAWYDLQGRKIQMPTQRGLYIHNGKKIVVK